MMIFSYVLTTVRLIHWANTIGTLSSITVMLPHTNDDGAQAEKHGEPQQPPSEVHTPH